MRWMDIKSVTGLSVNELKSDTEIQNILAFISEQHSQEEKMDQYLFQGEDNGKSLHGDCCLVHPEGSPGDLVTRLASP